MKGTIQPFEVKDIGTVWVAQNSKGICRLEIGLSKQKFLNSLPKNITWTEKKLCSGKIPKGPLDISSGTIFQQKVWQQIIKIPKGETRSYAWLAKMAGKPKAVRAAANACGANPIPLLIPCHRVIKTDGSIGGFTGPLSLKRKLLKLEGKNWD